MKHLISAAAAAAALAMVALSAAEASVVQFVNPNILGGNANEKSFVDIGALGFGNAPRLLTLHENGVEQGSVSPDGLGGLILMGDAISGANKASAPTVGDLGWGTGNQVAIGFNTAQTGNSGITLEKLSLNLFDPFGLLKATFSILAPITFSEDDLDLQQGNGQGLFGFVLDAAQQAQWNGFSPTGLWRVGLYAKILDGNGGPDSFLALKAGTLTPVPIPGALPMFGAALSGMLWLKRRRKAA